MKYNPSKSGPGPCTTAAISVYTEKHNMDVIGFRLIEMVKQDINYKTNAEAWKTRYQAFSKKFKKTLYWNGGKPSVQCKVETSGIRII